MTKVDKLRFFDPDAPSEDAIDGLLDRLSGDDSKTKTGSRIHRNSENGAIAVFPSVPFFPQGSPEQRKLESDWEKKAVEMHANQKPIPPLAAKPIENILAKIALQRGD